MSDKKAALGFYINSKDWGDGDAGEITAFKVQAAESWEDGRLSRQEEIDKLKAVLDAIHLRAVFELSESPGHEVEALQEICDLAEGMEVSDD